MAGQLRPLPGAQMIVKFPAQLGHLLANALQVGAGRVHGAQAHHLVNLTLDALDLALSIVVSLRQRITSTASAPHIWRTASTSLSSRRTRWLDRSVATLP